MLLFVFLLYSYKLVFAIIIVLLSTTTTIKIMISKDNNILSLCMYNINTDKLLRE